MKLHHFTWGLMASCAYAAMTISLSAAEADWGYSGEKSPEHWAELDEHNVTCAEGEQQSPIDISGGIEAKLPKLKIDWEGPNGLMEINNGHTIQVRAPESSTLRRGDDSYELVQFHFHAPSEHLIGEKSFPMEAHFVHTKDDGALGVLAVMLVPGDKNEAFAKLATSFPKSEEEAVFAVDVDPKDLLPEKLDYWFYEGSLTTPPCSENVDWIILKEPVQVDPADIARFTKIYSENARPVHETNRRFILGTE